MIKRTEQERKPRKARMLIHMESNQPSLFLLFITTTIINLSIISASPPLVSSSASPSPSPSPVFSPRPTLLPPAENPPPPIPRQPLPSPPQQQLNNIVDALIGAGDFTNWVNIISMTNPVSLPLSATLFIPDDNAINGLPTMDPFMFPYHIVPQRLIFSDLLLFNAHARLPTLLPGKSIIITNNSPSNFTIDNSEISHPDLYTTATLAVHGVRAVLDYSVYGDGLSVFPTPNTKQPEVSTPPPNTPPFLPIGQVIGWRSDAACLCTEFPIVFVIVCGVLALKMTRNSLTR